MGLVRSGGCPISQEGKLDVHVGVWDSVPQDWLEGEAASEPTHLLPRCSALTLSPCRKRVEHSLPRSGS